MTNEKEAAPSHIVVTELDTLITRLTDAAFDCGDYDDSKSDDGCKILFDAEQKAIDDLKTYVATVRAEEREAAFRDVKRVIAEAAAKCPVFIFHSKQGKEFLMNALETASTGSRKGEG